MFKLFPIGCIWLILSIRLLLHMRIQGDLHSALAANTSLATRHRELQNQFIETKTAALRVLERKLDLETSLRDHKQVRTENQPLSFGCIIITTSVGQ